MKTPQKGGYATGLKRPTIGPYLRPREAAGAANHQHQLS